MKMQMRHFGGGECDARMGREACFDYITHNMRDLNAMGCINEI